MSPGEALNRRKGRTTRNIGPYSECSRSVEPRPTARTVDVSFISTSLSPNRLEIPGCPVNDDMHSRTMTITVFPEPTR